MHSNSSVFTSRFIAAPFSCCFFYAANAGSMFRVPWSLERTINAAPKLITAICVRLGMPASKAERLLKSVRLQPMQDDGQKLTTMLGEAVKRSWGSLPRDIQELLFEEALNGDAGGDDALREQLALLLHELHPRTSS
jgi:hypothetical protein